MKENILTHEEAVSRFNKAKRRKSEVLNIVEEHLKKSYEKETGLKANYFFAM